jgi:hypothetical protein
MKKYFLILFALSIIACKKSLKEYYPSGELKYEFEIDSDSIPHGKFRSYSEDGTLLAELVYDHGKRNGKHILYYPSKTIKEIYHYSHGVLKDSIVEYYESGKIKKVLQTKDGKINGSRKEFYENGSISFISNNIDSIIHGESISFDKNGFINLWTYHDKDSLISYVLYNDKNPKLIEKEQRIVTIETNLKDKKCKLGDTIKLNFGLLGPVLEKDKKTLRNYYTYFEARKWKLCLDQGNIGKNNRTYINWVPDSAGFYEVRVYTKYKNEVYSTILTNIIVGNPNTFKDVPFEIPKDKCRFNYDYKTNKIITLKENEVTAIIKIKPANRKINVKN